MIILCFFLLSVYAFVMGLEAHPLVMTYLIIEVDFLCSCLVIYFILIELQSQININAIICEIFIILTYQVITF